MTYNHTVTKILDILKSNKCWFETFDHPPVRTSEEAAKLRPGYDLCQGAKAMIVRIKMSESNKKFAMLVLPGNLRFDSNKVKTFFNAKDIRLATEEEVITITNGVQPGGVPPFGNLFNLELVVDPLLFDNEKIIFNAGDRGFSIAMLSKDYEKLVTPKIVPITVAEH